MFYGAWQRTADRQRLSLRGGHLGFAHGEAACFVCCLPAGSGALDSRMCALLAVSAAIASISEVAFDAL